MRPRRLWSCSVAWCGLTEGSNICSGPLLIHSVLFRQDANHSQERLRIAVATAVYDAVTHTGGAVVDCGLASSVVAASERSLRRSATIIGATVAALSSPRTDDRCRANTTLRHIVRPADGAKVVSCAFALDVAKNIARGGRIACILAGGSERCGVREALEASRRSIPVLVIAGSGGAAEQLSLMVGGAPLERTLPSSPLLAALATSDCARVLPADCLSECLHLALTISI